MQISNVVHELESKFGSEYGREEAEAMLAVLAQNAPTSGEACLQFERDFAAYCGVAHARAVSNGTAALFLSLIAAGVGPGDRVLTTPLTWIATAAAAATLGATVDFVDVEPQYYTLDPAQLAAKLTPDVKAVIPVHLYGQCCDMDAILALSREHGFAVIEDACHAPGAQYRGRMAGALGAAGCFSFHEQKNISTLGEGGMVTTSDPDLFERVALYRSHCTRVHGKSTKYCSLDETRFPVGKRFWWQDFEDTGYNFRMTDMQAAVGIIQLRKLDALNRRRIEIAMKITEGLHDVPGLTLPAVRPENRHVFHLYPLEIHAERFGMDKDDFILVMREKGVKIGTHYIPLHWSTAFQKRGFRKGQFPVADALAERLVTLPIHPRLTDEGVQYLVASIRSIGPN